jgi:predicted nuclease with TOPRIM domain
MDVKLQNAYVEVLLDNFLSVVKQNVMFQAQLKTLSDSGDELVNTKKALEELNTKYNDCQKEATKLSNLNNALQVDNTNKQGQIQHSENIVNEKNRLQSAVNDYMKQVKRLEDERVSKDVTIAGLNSNISSLNKYIENLESLVPVTKLKKLKSDIEATNDNIKNGGSF